MQTHQQKEKQSHHLSEKHSEKHEGTVSSGPVTGPLSGGDHVRRIQDLAKESPQGQKAARLQSRIHNGAHMVAQRKRIQHVFGDSAAQRKVNSEEEQKETGTTQLKELPSAGGDLTLQRKKALEEETPVQDKSETVQKKENKTGLPDGLKSGIENLSGYSMNDVKVHYNSDRPAQVQAHAFAQGTDIHIASGQERHLPHEAWHVVQQKQGRVQPTMQMKGKLQVNDDAGLEKEADAMGEKASSFAIQKKSNNIQDSGFAGKSAETGALPDNGSLKTAGDLIQRKVIIGGAPAVELEKGKALVNKEEISIPEEKMSWVKDLYARRYKDADEFRKHANGGEVDCGLAKKPGRWYRLEQFSAKEFFVLGEYHNGFGYRELIKESNQKGKVLGEGGSNSLMTATPDSPLEKNKGVSALKNDNNESREYTMENPVSKAYFGLIAYRLAEKKKTEAKKNTQSQQGGSNGILKEDGDTWLDNYQKTDKANRKRDQTYLPYYEKGNDKVYATHGTKAENYDSGKTGLSVLTTFFDAIDKKTTRTGYEIKAWSPARYFLETYKEATWGVTAEEEYNKLLAALEEGSKLEANLMAGKDGDHIKPFLEKQKEVQGTSGKPVKESEKAFAYRDFAMYHSVIKASQGDFIMAGMGDNHAKDLKEPLEKEGITVITLDEFLKEPISTDAIAPMEEQDTTFAQKEHEQEELKKEYLEELENIRKAKELEKNKDNLSTEEIKNEPVKVTTSMSKYLALIGIVVTVGAIITFGVLYSYGFFSKDK